MVGGVTQFQKISTDTLVEHGQLLLSLCSTFPAMNTSCCIQVIIQPRPPKRISAIFGVVNGQATR